MQHHPGADVREHGPLTRSGRRFAVAIAFASVLLGGCLVKLAYQNLDTVLLWRIDGFFDLSPSQSRFIEQRLDEHLRWHRAEELPKTIAFFQRVQTAAQDSLTPAEIEDLFDNFGAGVSAIALRVSADAAEFFARVDDEQLARLERELEEANEEWAERLELPVDERREEREERILDYVEDWIGDLSDTQRRELALASRRIPDILEAWLAHRRERQRQFVNIVRSARIDTDIVRIALPAWMTAEPPVQFQVHQRAVREFILEVDKHCTPEQRRFFNDKLQDWIADLQSLSAPPS
jgi:hypothetical protein